jgi:hypothetical protein
MDAKENSLLVIPWSESAEGPLADARGDRLQAVMPSVARHLLLGHGMEVPRLTPRKDMEGETPR